MSRTLFQPLAWKHGTTLTRESENRAKVEIRIGKAPNPLRQYMSSVEQRETSLDLIL